MLKHAHVFIKHEVRLSEVLIVCEDSFTQRFLIGGEALRVESANGL